METTFFSRTLKTLAAVLLFALAQAASAVTVDDIIKRGKLMVAIDTNNPPWGQMDAKMQPEGIDVAVATLMAKYMGVPLEIVPVTSQNRIPFVVTGKADLVMATLTITPQRALQIWYSIPYAFQDSVIMTTDNSPMVKPTINSISVTPRFRCRSTVLHEGCRVMMRPPQPLVAGKPTWWSRTDGARPRRVRPEAPTR